jgi:hypothetical protein
VDKKNAAVEERAAPAAALQEIKPEAGNVSATEQEQRRQRAEAAAAGAGTQPPAGVKMDDDDNKLWWYLAHGEENVLHN